MARCFVCLALSALLAAQGSCGRAALFYIDYQAGSWSTAVSSPVDYGWLASMGDAVGAPVLNSGNQARNAWRIADTQSAAANPNFQIGINARGSAHAARDGWRLSTFARYVDDFGTGPNLGITAYMGNREYDLMLALDEARNLRATLFDESPLSFTLTKAGDGTAAFHNFALWNVAGTSRVDFYFDGKLVNGSHAWDGYPLSHPNSVQWGNSDRAGSQRGAMDFDYVAMLFGPFDNPGDFDSSGRADGLDFIGWQTLSGSSYDARVDVSGNGLVDADDLRAWEAAFGANAAEQAGVPLPEPHWQVALLALGWVGTRPRRIFGR